MNSSNNLIFPTLFRSEEWSAVPTVIDECGSLVAPSLHDADFLGLIKVDQHRYVLLFAQAGTRGQVALVLRNVVLLRANNFCAGNIVLDVIIENGNQENTCSLKSDLEELYGVSEIKSEKALLSAYSVIEKQVEKIEAGNLFILTITPSYGCKLVALCESMEVFAIV